MSGSVTRLAQKEIAARLGLSTRQISNLAELGMPKQSKGGRVSYPWPESLRWYIAYKVKVGLDEKEPASFDLARARKTEAEARLAEIELAIAEGKLIGLDEYEKAETARGMRVRAVVMAMPSKHMGKWQQVRSDLDAVAALETIRNETLVALQGSGLDEEG